MTYGVNARVGNLTVFSKQGAINAYKIFAELFYKKLTMEASVVLSNASKDMYALGFTPAEVEDIELSVL